MGVLMDIGKDQIEYHADSTESMQNGCVDTLNGLQLYQYSPPTQADNPFETCPTSTYYGWVDISSITQTIRTAVIVAHWQNAQADYISIPEVSFSLAFVQTDWGIGAPTIPAAADSAWKHLGKGAVPVVLDVQSFYKKTDRLVIKVECGPATCRKLILYGISLYEEVAVDANFYKRQTQPDNNPADIMLMPGRTFSINCDPTQPQPTGVTETCFRTHDGLTDQSQFIMNTKTSANNSAGITKALFIAAIQQNYVDEPDTLKYLDQTRVSRIRIKIQKRSDDSGWEQFLPKKNFSNNNSWQFPSSISLDVSGSPISLAKMQVEAEKHSGDASQAGMLAGMALLMSCFDSSTCSNEGCYYLSGGGTTDVNLDDDFADLTTELTAISSSGCFGGSGMTVEYSSDVHLLVPQPSNFQVDLSTEKSVTFNYAAKSVWLNALSGTITLTIAVKEASTVISQQQMVITYTNQCESSTLTFNQNADIRLTVGDTSLIDTDISGFWLDTYSSAAMGNGIDACKSQRVYVQDTVYSESWLQERKLLSSVGQESILRTQVVASSINGQSPPEYSLFYTCYFKFGATTVGSVTGQIKIKIVDSSNSCTEPTLTKGYDSTKTIQVRQGKHKFSPPKWSENAFCITAKDPTVQYHYSDSYGTFLIEPPQGNRFSAQKDQVTKVPTGEFLAFIETTKDMISQKPFIIRYTKYYMDSTDNAVQLAVFTESVVTYVDKCDQSDIEFVPFTDGNMVARVHQVITHEFSTSLGDDVTITTSADNTWLDPAKLNIDTCGNIKTSLLHLPGSITGQFVQSMFVWQTTSSDRYIRIQPTQNSHIGVHEVKIKHYFEEYPDKFIEVPVKITIKECKINTVKDSVSDPHPALYQYTMVRDAPLMINARRYDFQPACDYSEVFSISVSPQLAPPQDVFFSIDTSTAQVQIESKNIYNQGIYTFTVSSSVTGYPADYPAIDTSRSFIVQVNDPCQSTTLKSQIAKQIDLHFLIGQLSKTYKIKDFKDTVSIELDDPSNPFAGYILCQGREHQIHELLAQGGELATGEGTGRTYITHKRIDATKEIEITYGSSDFSVAGQRSFVIDAWLNAYTSIRDKTVQLDITFHRQEADLKIQNQEYTINQGTLAVDLPKLSLTPALHQSLDPSTGENGAVILLDVFLLEGSQETPLPQGLATLDRVSEKITIDCNDVQQMGLRKVRVTYNFQDYLRGARLQTDFTVLVLPQPVSDQYSVEIRPTFQLDNYQTYFQVKFGSPWSAELPAWYHQDSSVKVLYLKPEFGKASTFMKYDQGLGTINIAANSTSEVDIGSYPVELKLIDTLGVYSEKLTLTVNIVANATTIISLDEKDSNETSVNTTVRGNFANSNFQSTGASEESETNSTDIGALFEMLLKMRLKKLKSQVKVQIEAEPPKVEISNIDSLGRMQIAFSKPMVLIPELVGMNQDGIIASKLGLGRRLSQARVKYDVFEIKMQPGDMTDEADLSFSWRVTEFTSDNLELKIDFDLPLRVSMSGSEADKVEIAFKASEIFIDEENGSPIEANTKIVKTLPRQFENEQIKQQIEKASQVMSGGTSAIFAGNLALSLPLSISLQYLWDMINAQQIVILLPLLTKVQIPQNAYLFFQQLMKIAAFEIIPTDKIYVHLSDVKGIPFSDTFEELGFEHHLILDNFGTLGMISALIPFAYLLNAMLQQCKCQNKNCRVFFKNLNRKLYWGLTLRLILESYVIGFICCLLNLNMLDVTSDADNWTLANGVISIVVFSIVCFFPFVAVYYMHRNFKSLKEDKIIAKYGEVYQGYSTKSRKMLIFWLLDILRKAGICLAIICASEQLWLQMLVVFFSSVTLIIAATITKARNTNFDRRMDIFNESKLILLMYHMIMFTAFIPSARAKFYIGYSCTGLLLLGVLVNMIMLVVLPFKLFTYKQRLRYHVHRERKRLAKLRGTIRISAKSFDERRKSHLDELIKRAKELLKFRAQAEENDEQRSVKTAKHRKDRARNMVIAAAAEYDQKEEQRHEVQIPQSSLSLIDETKDNVANPGISRNSIEQLEEEKQSDIPEAPQLSLDDISYLWIEHGIGIGDIMQVPGYENFVFSENPNALVKSKLDIFGKQKKAGHIPQPVFDKSAEPQIEDEEDIFKSFSQILQPAIHRNEYSAAYANSPKMSNLQSAMNDSLWYENKQQSRMPVRNRIVPNNTLQDIIDEKYLEPRYISDASPEPPNNRLLMDSAIANNERNRQVNEHDISEFYELQ